MDSGAAHVLLLLAAIIAALALFYLRRGASVESKPTVNGSQTPPASPSAAPPNAPDSRTPTVWRAGDRQSFDLDCSVFAPEVVDGHAEFAIQAILHEADAEAAAGALAARLDPDASVRARSPLETQISAGDVLEVRLVAPDLDVEQPIQRRAWRGRETAIVFIARFKSETSATETLARVLVYYEGVPVGYVVFRIARREAQIAAWTDPPPTAARLRRFTSAFMSYSSADRLHVLRHHQLLALVGIKVFQDILSLDPGQRWASRLYESIEDCDLVLVYWSTAAAESQWVRKEVEYALALQQTRPDSSPTIVPVLLEGPPPPRPPDSLAALHFDDPLRYIIYAHEELEVRR